FLSPVVADWAERRRLDASPALGAAQRAELTEIAQRAWTRQTGVKPAGPLDTAFHLMALVSAHDLGLVTEADLMQQLDETLRHVEMAKSCHGHLLAPLAPERIVTEHSGWLAAALMVVVQLELDADSDPSIASPWVKLRAQAESLFRRMDFSALY